MANVPTKIAGGIQGPPTPTNAVIRLQTLSCVSQAYGPVDPYLWPALVGIDKSNFGVEIVAPPVGDAHVLLQNNIPPGDSAAIPTFVGELVFQMQKELNNFALIVAVILWEQSGASDTPSNVVQAGYEAYTSALQQAITHNLVELSNASTRSQAENAVQTAVTAAIQDAIRNKLSDWQIVEIYFSSLILDSEVAGSFVAFDGPSLKDTSFTISLGEELIDSAGKPLRKLYTIAGTLSLVPQIVQIQ